MKNPFTLHSSKIVYKNRWIEVQEDRITHPDNGEGVYTYIKTRDSVVLVPIDDHGRVYMIYTFRYPTKVWKWELPAGGGNDGEPVFETSHRELAEETGILAKRWDNLGATNVWNGLAVEQQHTLLARDLELRPKPKSDDAALIRDGRFFSFNQVYQMIEAGEVDDNQTMTSLYLAELFLKKEAMKKQAIGQDKKPHGKSSES